MDFPRCGISDGSFLSHLSNPANLPRVSSVMYRLGGSMLDTVRDRIRAILALSSGAESPHATI